MTEDPSFDGWLDGWLAVVGPPRPGLTILELGCGWGLDTEILLDKGYGVVAADLSEENLRRGVERAPGASRLLLDLCEPLPLADDSFDVAMASLCLHYFDWDRTERALAEVHRILNPGGLLAVRVNSTRDVHHGAVGHPQISPNFYDVDGSPKRFFDRDTIDRLFGKHWAMTSVKEMTIQRWELPKVVWEVFAVKSTR